MTTPKRPNCVVHIDAATMGIIDSIASARDIPTTRAGLVREWAQAAYDAHLDRVDVLRRRNAREERARAREAEKAAAIERARREAERKEAYLRAPTRTVGAAWDSSTADSTAGRCERCLTWYEGDAVCCGQPVRLHVVTEAWMYGIQTGDVVRG